MSPSSFVHKEEAAQKAREEAARKAGEEARRLEEELWNEEVRRQAKALTLKSPSPPSSSSSASSSLIFPQILPVEEIDISFSADLSVNMSRAELERMVHAELHKLREFREKLLKKVHETSQDSECQDSHAGCSHACSSSSSIEILSSSVETSSSHTECSHAKSVETSDDSSSECSDNSFSDDSSWAALKKTRKLCIVCKKRVMVKNKRCQNLDCWAEPRRKCKWGCGSLAVNGKDICTKTECGGKKRQQTIMPLCKKCGKKPAIRPGKVGGNPGKKGYCKKCGGGSRCTEPGCKYGAAPSYKGTGKPGKCRGHMGGDRCEK